MKKKLFAIPLCAAFVLSAACFTACSKGGDDTAKYGLKPTEAVVLPDYGDRTTDAAVHDPSVFQDPKDGTYYAFGSHYAVACSSDLIHWEQLIEDDGDEDLFEGGIRAAMPETLKLVGNQQDAWAPDVEYYNGKYYMYISFTTGFGSDSSVIARVESDSVLGPYSNETMIVNSVLSQKDKPNCIDPELFYDKNGGLWMVYGSFFGGVYIKELYSSGENWGLPKENGEHDFGKLLWRNGESAGVEGPYVFYNELTDYYYLMTSEGDLFSVYNMRIARSKTPNGPYLDINGKDVSTNEGAGNKIAGNYKFERAGADMGYAALGHNSVIKNKEGKYFVVYHTRRQTGTSKPTVGHNLCVSQLFFNEQGWPVMSPVCYEGETFGTVEASELAQTYEIVIHTEATQQAPAVSEDYELTADGKVTKGSAEVGEWSLKEGYYVALTIDGKNYNGVVVPGWDMYALGANQEGRLCLTAVSDQGIPLWAIGGKVS